MENNQRRARRGRPPGRTEQGERTREAVYEAATALFVERGYEATTMRQVAEAAGVSPGLTYRYFPSKQAIVLELYQRLTARFRDRTEALPAGAWTVRFDHVLVASLEALRDHREPLRATLTTMLIDRETGLFSEAAAPTRQAVRARFVEAVTGAADAPDPEMAAALGRLLDLVQLGVILWWVLDRSPEQRATAGLLGWLRATSGAATMALWLPGMSEAVRVLDSLASDALDGGS